MTSKARETPVNPLRTFSWRAAAAASVLAALSACPPPVEECIEGDEDVCDGGALPPDFCNSQQEAEADATNCHLSVGRGATAAVRKAEVYLSRLPDGGADQDWYFAQAPADLTPRSLLHVSAGYQAPQTAVNFSMNVVKVQPSGQLQSVATGLDKHGAAAPKLVDLVVPFTEAGAKLFFLAADEGGAQVRVDNRNPYSVLVEFIENPDGNEPNDTTPTAIPLAPMGMEQRGTQSGYLATNDDVDLYSFQVTGSGRQIIYVRLTGPDPHPQPAPPYRLSYTLRNPSGTAIAEGVMNNEFLRIDLATARLAPMTGTYTLEVRGYKVPNQTAPVRGDPKLQYGVEVRVLPDIDPEEPNDTAATPRLVTLTPNATRALTGKLSWVADEEWFLVSLPARSGPSTLRYRTTVAASGGRFEPLSGVASRLVRIARKVTVGATAQDRQVACRTDPVACPKGYSDSSSGAAMLVEGYCNNSNPTQCLYSHRNEEPLFSNLKNLVGAIPVPAGQASEFYVMFGDEGRGVVKYADDRDWTLELDWRDDGDEAARTAGPTPLTLSGTTSTASGELTYGFGKVLEPFDINTGAGVRGPNDYDAFETDTDLFQFSLAGLSGEQSLELSWELMHPDGGTRPPGDIALELTFCSGPGTGADGGLCAGQQRRILAYNGDRVTPWYLPQSFGNAQVLFSRQDTGGSTTITALPVGCWCLSSPRTAAGVFYANIAGVNRTSNEPIQYRVRQRVTTYPGTYPTADGGTGTCPVTDGGCGFAR